MRLSDLHDQINEGIRNAYRTGHFTREEALMRIQNETSVGEERATEILDWVDRMDKEGDPR